MKKALLLLPLQATLGCTAFAQTAFFEDASSDLPPGLADACMDAAAGDADGDGDADLVLAMEFQRNRLLLNDGHGRFTDASSSLPDTVHDSEDVSFTDIDGDGDLDLFFVSEDDQTDELYLNDGNASFSDISTRLNVNRTANAHAVLDINRDGAPDLLFGNVGPDTLLLNNGDGTFTDGTDTRWPQTADSRTQDLELFDADGDGDMDLAVGNEGQNQLYLNETGVLREVTPSHLPERNDETREIRALDADNDGDMDLAVANVAFLTQGTAGDYLLLNDGSGRFTISTAAFPEDARSNFTVQSLDIDRDGDSDLLLPSTVFPSNQQSLFLAATGPDGEHHLYQINAFRVNDRDGDGDLDITSSVDSQQIVFINDDGEFTLRTAALTPLQPDRLDFDNDGSNELAIWSSALTLEDSGAALYSQRNLEFFDIDDNGSIEVMGATQSIMHTVGDTLLLLNDGSGSFSKASTGAYLPAISGNTFDIEVVDFNADGLQDLFFCNRASAADAPGKSGGAAILLRGI